MNAKSTGQKGKGNKREIKTSKSKPIKSRSEYNQIVIDLNRQLAKLKIKSEEGWNKRCDTEEKATEKTKELSDVMNYLQYDIELHQNEISKLTSDIEQKTKVLAERNDRNQQEIKKLKEKNEEAKKDLDEKIFYTKGTLTILNHFNNERIEFLQRSTNLRQEETEQEERHKSQIYETDKNHRIKIDQLKNEATKQLEILREKTLAIINKADCDEKFPEKYALIEEQLIKNMDTYQKLYNESKVKQAIKNRAAIRVEIKKEEIKIIHNQKHEEVIKRVPTREPRKWSGKAIRTNERLSCTISENSAKDNIENCKMADQLTYSPDLKKACDLIETINCMARLSVSLETKASFASGVSIDFQEEEFKELESSLKTMASLIDDYFSVAKRDKNLTFRIFPWIPKRSLKRRINLDRNELMRNWRRTNKEIRKNLKNELGILCQDD